MDNPREKVPERDKSASRRRYKFAKKNPSVLDRVLAASVKADVSEFVSQHTLDRLTVGSIYGCYQMWGNTPWNRFWTMFANDTFEVGWVPGHPVNEPVIDLGGSAKAAAKNPVGPSGPAKAATPTSGSVRSKAVATASRFQEKLSDEKGLPVASRALSEALAMFQAGSTHAHIVAMLIDTSLTILSADGYGSQPSLAQIVKTSAPTKETKLPSVTTGPSLSAKAKGKLPCVTTAKLSYKSAVQKTASQTSSKLPSVTTGASASSSSSRRLSMLPTGVTTATDDPIDWTDSSGFIALIKAASKSCLPLADLKFRKENPLYAKYVYRAEAAIRRNAGSHLETIRVSWPGNPNERWCHVCKEEVNCENCFRYATVHLESVDGETHRCDTHRAFGKIKVPGSRGQLRITKNIRLEQLPSSVPFCGPYPGPEYEEMWLDNPDHNGVFNLNAYISHARILLFDREGRFDSLLAMYENRPMPIPTVGESSNSIGDGPVNAGARPTPSIGESSNSIGDGPDGPPVKHYREEDIIIRPTLVGAPGTCWEKLGWNAYEKHAPVLKGDKMTVDRLLCFKSIYIGWKTREDYIKACKDIVWVSWKRTTDLDFHIEDVWETTWRAHPRDIHGNLRKPATLAAIGGEWLMLPEFLDLIAENNMKWKGVLDSQWCEPVLLGSAHIVVDEAMRVLGTDLAKGAAQQLFTTDYESLPSVPFRMTPGEIKQFSNYVGFPVRSTQAKQGSSDHLFLQSARHLIRTNLDHLRPHNKDAMRSLHVGATMYEVEHWWKRPAHHFYLAMKESKDIARIIPAACDWAARRFTEQNLPALEHPTQKTLRMRYSNPQQVFDVVTTNEDRRVFVAEPPKSQYMALYFEDSLYSMSVDQFMEYWVNTGATVGYATMFLPDFLLDKHHEDSPYYNIDMELPTEVELRQFIDATWPTALVATPLLPLGDIAAAVHKTLTKMAELGWAKFYDVAKELITGSYPIETALGVGLDISKLGPIVEQVLHKYLPTIVEKLASVSVTWKGGHSNGYRHRLATWKTWTKPRHKGPGFYVDMEVSHRVGEMYLLIFHRTMGETDIVSSLSIPESRQVVLVADLETAYRNGSVCDPEYFPVNMNDWFRLKNFCLDQPVESLTFSVVSTTLNRIRGGLALGSRQLVDEMSVKPADTSKFALACLMDALNSHNAIGLIEEDPEIRDAFESNMKKFSKTIAKTGLVIATGGLAFAGYYLFKWLKTERPTIEFVKYPARKKAVPVKGTTLLRSPQVDRPVEINVKLHKGKESSGECNICRWWSRGWFSTDGVPMNGQKFHVHNHSSENVTWNVDESESGQLLTWIRDAQTDHGTSAVVTHIKALKSFVEHRSSDLNYSFKFDYVMGGPGTGKSVILRKIAYEYEMMYGGATGSNSPVMIIVPFNALQADYIACSVMGVPGKHSFNVKTPWYGAQQKAAKVLLVDEVSAISWDHVCLLAMYTGAEHVIVAGDNKQCGIRPEAGEGSSMFDALGPKMADVQTHELVMNYRLDAWRTKLHNHLFGYRMIAHRTDIIPPQVITLDEYKAMSFLKKDHREIVFAHATAEALFGTPSTPGGKNGQNLSVRSTQGKTFKTAAVGVTAMDENLLAMDSMLNVANSRSTHNVYYVTPADANDPIPVNLARRLYIDSQERIDYIAAKPWPKFEAAKAEVILTTEQENMTRALARAKDEAQMAIGDAPLEWEPIEFLEKPIEIEYNYSWVRDKFATCLLDPVYKDKPELGRQLDAYLQTIWADDDAMGRMGMVTKITKYLCSGSTPLPRVGGKTLLPIDQTLRFLDSLGVKIIAFEGANAKKLKVDNPVFEFSSAKRDKADFYYLLDGMHASTIKMEPIKVRCGNMIEAVDPFLPVRLNSGHGYMKDLPKGDDGIPVLEAKKTKHEKFTFDSEEVLRKIYEKPAEKLDEWTNVEVPDLTKVVFSMNVGVEPQTVYKTVVRQFTTAPRFGNRLASLRSSCAGMELSTLDWQDTGLQRVKERVVDDEYRFYTDVAKPIGAYKHAPITLGFKDATAKAKLRMGTDAYRLIPFLDPSGASQEQHLNWQTPFKGVNRPVVFKRLSVEGLLWKKTRAGKLRPLIRRRWKQVLPGMANHFSDSPVEVIQTTERYASGRLPKQLTAEAKQWCDKVADEAFRDKWKADHRVPQEIANSQLDNGLDAAYQRNYYKRGKAFQKTWRGLSLTMSGKVQEKPIKNDKLNLEKTGQGIMQSPPDFNAQWILWARMLGFTLSEALKDHVVTDDRRRDTDFLTDLTLRIRALPNSVQTAILDAKEFDSQQGPVTVYLERCIMKKLGFSESDISNFHQIRHPAKFVSPGLLSAYHTGQKGSGFLDTKCGNTTTELVLASQIWKGVGPKVEAAKGDDYLLMQTGLKLNETGKAQVKAIAGIDFETGIGDGEFLGCSVNRNGITPSATRVLSKINCRHIRDEAHFHEYRQSVLNTVAKWKALGIHELIHYSAAAEGKSPEYVEACVAAVESFSHLSYQQYCAFARECTTYGYTLPQVDGKTAFPLW